VWFCKTTQDTLTLERHTLDALDKVRNTDRKRQTQNTSVWFEGLSYSFSQLINCRLYIAARRSRPLEMFTSQRLDL
jgi:hypothetical protein